MIINITNISSKTAFVYVGKKAYKINGRKSRVLKLKGERVRIGIRPRKSSMFFDMRSSFTVLTEYEFYDYKSVSLTIDYSEAITPNDAQHKYCRFADICGNYSEFYSICPEGQVKSDTVIDRVIGSVLGYFVEWFWLVLLISVGLALAINSVKVGMITFIIGTIIALLLDKLFDSIGDKIGEKFFNKGLRLFGKNPPQKESPKYFEECSQSEYIANCFR